jgi:ribosomal protein S18 acetylase RimI-like enzyme
MPSIDRYATPLRVPMPIDLFWRLPNLGSYAAQYKGDSAELSYQPRWSMGRLRVAAPTPSRETALSKSSQAASGEVLIRALNLNESHDALARVFVEAFARFAPLDTMAATTRRHAADAALRHTASGGDGPVVAPACLGAHLGRKLVGAAIVTRLTLRADEWPEPDVPASLTNLTWLFVAPDQQRRGIGSRLLQGVVSILAAQGEPWLVSHVHHDNAQALLFHWRRGFELVPCVKDGTPATQVICHG